MHMDGCKTCSHLHIILHAVKKLLHARQLLQLHCLVKQRLHCTSVLQSSLPHFGQQLDLLNVRHSFGDYWISGGCDVMPFRGI